MTFLNDWQQSFSADTRLLTPPPRYTATPLLHPLLPYYNNSEHTVF